MKYMHLIAPFMKVIQVIKTCGQFDELPEIVADSGEVPARDTDGSMPAGAG